MKMGIKNWNLYLESSESDNHLDEIKDVFVNLYDEYEIRIFHEGHSDYKIWINVGFNLNLSPELDEIKDIHNYRDKLKKLENLSLLIEEAVSRFENSKWSIRFGHSTIIDWSENNDDLDGFGDQDWIVLVKLSIIEKSIKPGELFIQDGTNLLISLDRLKEIIKDCGFTLRNEISNTNTYYGSETMSVIRFCVNEPLAVWERTVSKPNILETTVNLINELSYMSKMVRKIDYSLSVGVFNIESRPGHRIILV